MQKFLALCGAVLCFAVAVAAQDNSTAPATTPGATTASPARRGGSEMPGWQVGINYNFVRFRSESRESFNMQGFNTTVTRYVSDWFGLEGYLGAVSGDTPASGGPGPFTAGNLRAKLIQYGGGPHLAYRHRSKFEPWVHALFGGAHFRFSQTGPPTANLTNINAFAYTVGGGADYKLGFHLYLRGQGDFMSTRFFKTWQKNAQIQGGIVINF